MAKLLYATPEEADSAHLDFAHSWDKIEGNIQLLRIEREIVVCGQQIIEYLSILKTDLGGDSGIA